MSIYEHIKGKELKICFKNAIDYFDLTACTSSEAVSAASPWTVWHPYTGHPTYMAMQWGHAGSPSHGMDDLICHDKGWGTWETGSRLGVPRGQAESRPLETLILDPLWSDLWCLTSWEKLWRYEVLASTTCKPLTDLPGSSQLRIMCCYV